MKLLKVLSAVAAAGLLAFSCSKTVTSKPTVSFPVSSFSFLKDGGNETVSVTISNAEKVIAKAWTDGSYTKESDWLTVSYAAGRVQLSAGANDTSAEREAVVRVVASNSAGSTDGVLKVKQAPGGGTDPGTDPGTQPGEEPQISLSMSEKTVPASGESFEVTVTTNGSYLWVDWFDENYDDVDWIDCQEGSSEDEIIVIVEPNSGDSRTAYFEVDATFVDWEAMNWDSSVPYGAAYIVITQEAGNGGTPGGDDPVDPATGGGFTKVTASSQLTDGWYLIVCENKGLAMDGSLGSELDKANNTVSVKVSDGKIAESDALSAAAFYYDSSNGSLSTKDGHFISWATADKNGLAVSTSAQKLTVSISGGDADITTASRHHLRYNSSSGQERFRFFKDASYTNQQAVQLYKQESAPKVPEFSVSSAILSCGPKPSQLSFTVKASEGIEWKAACSGADFCTLSQESGTGSATVKVSVSENLAEEARTAVITVSTDNEEVAASSYEITLTQGPASDGNIDNGTPGYEDHLLPRRKTRIL